MDYRNKGTGNWDKVWFITGTSQGIGLTLVQKVLETSKDRVVATTRNTKALCDLERQHKDRLLVLEMDITKEDIIQQCVEESLKRFQRIDVLVNNAGYGVLGSLEELTQQEIKDHFEVNVFSVFNVCRHVLPVMRKQMSGTIFNLSSMVGFYSCFPGNVSYSATKFAIAGMTESLALEVSKFNIRVVIVYPGRFATNFFAPTSYKRAEKPMDGIYDTKEIEQVCVDSQGKQKGDPYKLAKILIVAANSEKPPLHLFIGQDSISFAQEKLKIIQNDIDQWKHLTMNTDR
ncbi:short-chain dehydrogenase/reductase (SDR) family protein [Tieghemostelium lacteum]|uniref:Short-chain dehydrogenase/reductase (SDR) family protein n=1 Tax=Tieghemostelium lacteum TaxID=361077 RepID=A0A151ZCQ8_TIELA|nr:short-chain dehydrogenase/reductase (SDR) family protein [Tieghemostelium lacteum]|eukprot:KYQ91719.1 short-chain dehydrogenase/reductase (SDR) family protein [Tieghemostelium lacteum]